MDTMQDANNLNDYFIQKKFELLIEMKNKKFAGEIASLHSMVNKLNEEISELKKNLSNAPSPRAEAPASSAQSNFRAAEQQKSEPIKPRFGDYEPKDVAIEKFFYFGNKTK